MAVSNLTLDNLILSEAINNDRLYILQMEGYPRTNRMKIWRQIFCSDIGKKSLPRLHIQGGEGGSSARP